jgi:predicted glycoside hydrolase/deacetylase ChbG (UPF0249 family)
MYVVINCDDLGLHPAVRQAARELGRVGAISSATLMANGPDFDESARVRDVGIGVHLNLLRGAPLCPPERIPSLVGKDGLLLSDYGRLFRRYAVGRLSLDDVRREWSAQVERVIEAGVRPTHLDSEKHIHAWPRVGAVALEIACRYGIRWMRRPVERLRTSVPAAGFFRIAALAIFALAVPRNSPSISRPDFSWGIAEQGALLDPERFRRYAGSFRRTPRILEIVCHPGIPAEEDPPIDPRFGSLRVAGNWAVEYAALRNPAWKTTLADLKAQLVDYGQIPEQ